MLGTNKVVVVVVVLKMKDYPSLKNILQWAILSLTSHPFNIFPLKNTVLSEDEGNCWEQLVAFPNSTRPL